MTTQVIVELSDVEYEQAKRLAQESQQEVIDVVRLAMNRGLPIVEKEQQIFALPSANDSVVNDVADREMQAYIALHPMLKRKFLGHHVAIYEGKLIDHDVDRRALYTRIVASYPDEFVWLSKVEAEPLRTLVFRSPRFERIGAT